MTKQVPQLAMNIPQNPIVNGRLGNSDDNNLKNRPTATRPLAKPHSDAEEEGGDLLMFSDEDSANFVADDDDVLSEISSGEADQQLANMLKWDINDQKVYKLINHMICNGYPVDKVEEVVW